MIDAVVEFRYTSWVIRGLLEPRYRVLVAMLLLVGFYKVLLAHNQTFTEVDGGLYTDIATHVRDGEGLKTNVSILHKGMPYFPHPTVFYPLWLLVYGYTARFLPVPILKVGIWFPTVCYFVALVLAYHWARRSFPRRPLPHFLPWFDSGHLFVLMLGLNWTYFVFTSYPHTEGLAYALFFAALLRLQRAWDRPGWKTGLEMGVWCGLVVLTRQQLLLLPFALWAALAVAVTLSARRRQYLVMGVCSVVAMVVVMSPHYFFLKSFVHDFHWWHVVRVDRARASGVLSEALLLKQVASPWEYIVDRSAGFAVAFRWGSIRGYWRHFYVWQYALPLAGIVIAVLIYRSGARKSVRWAWSWLSDANNLNLVFILAYALGGFLSIHTVHKEGHGEWNFQRRHGLTSFFLFYLSLRYLLVQRGRVAKLVGIALLCSGVVMGASRCRSTAVGVARSTPGPYRPELVDWINGQKENFDPLIIIGRKPQLIARFTPDVGYHWYFERTSPEDVRAMVEQLGAAYLLVNPKITHEKYPFFEDPRFKEWFRKVDTLSGLDIYRPRRALDATAWHGIWAKRDEARRNRRNKRRRPTRPAAVPGTPRPQ